jgi:hypothetical protein
LHAVIAVPASLYTCFVKVEDLPSELADWMQVNPRMPQRRGEAKKITGKVAQRIMNTLREEPALFVLKNQASTCSWSTPSM